jgi:hypothetical protein
VNIPPRERRVTSPPHALFRTTVDEVLELAEALPEHPTQADIEPMRERLLSIQGELEGELDLEHRMRSILTITSLWRKFESPAEAVEWIKEAVRLKGAFGPGEFRPPQREYEVWKWGHRYVTGVRAVIDAARHWNALLTEGITHPVHEVAGCPHCEAERRLREAIADLDSGLNSPSQ